MATKWQRFKIELPSDFTPIMRQQVGLEAIRRIVERTRERNIDKNGRRFPGYSKDYKNSLDFKIAGKSASSVDLTLSGEMLSALDVISARSGEVIVGFERGSEENAKADGNIRGTYGTNKPKPGKARDFLGLPSGVLNNIIREVRREADTTGPRRLAEIAAGVRAILNQEDEGGQ